MNNPILPALLDASEELADASEEAPRPVRLANGDDVARIVFKDEGLDSDGRLIGPAHAENSAGGVSINYGWITWKEAERLATALGVAFAEA